MRRELGLILFVLSVVLVACGGQEPTATQPVRAEPTRPAPPSPPPTETAGLPPPTDVPTGPAPASPTQTVVPPTDASPPPPPTGTALPATEAPEPTLPPFPPVVELEPVLGGLDLPIYLTHAGQAGQWFVVEQGGRIRLVEDGALRAAPFLDIADRVSCCRERGLLSVAFPPDFATSGLFYIDYTDRDGDTVVARYRLLEEAPLRADPSSEQVLLTIEQPAENHNGGLLKFGPDGYLYVGTGDGGRAGDPWGNAQNPDTLLGKLLRLDVSGEEGYAIPPDNPFVDVEGYRPEIWAWGLRNPWRFAFDRASGELYVADVGQNQYEEVNWQPAGGPGGQNYGWDVMEGGHCYEPAEGCERAGLVEPVAEYDHSLGCSVTGGYVYRGSQHPALQGVYVYGDFCSGRIWGLRREPSGEWVSALLLEAGVAISSFGEDAAGEIYVLGYGDGSLYRLIAVP